MFVSCSPAPGQGEAFCKPSTERMAASAGVGLFCYPGKKKGLIYPNKQINTII